jgi:hypothetical protein
MADVMVHPPLPCSPSDNPIRIFRPVTLWITDILTYHVSKRQAITSILTPPSCRAKALPKTDSWSPGVARADGVATLPHGPLGGRMSRGDRFFCVEVSLGRYVWIGLSPGLNMRWTERQGTVFQDILQQLTYKIDRDQGDNFRLLHTWKCKW